MTTWRGALRSIAAASRRAERESQRRRRELLQQQKYFERLDVLQQAAYEVEVYENQVSVLTSVHKECSQPWKWQTVKVAERPRRPEYSDEKQRIALTALEQYTPTLLDRVLRREKKQRDALAQAVEHIRIDSQRRYKEVFDQYKNDLAEWDRLQQIVDGILAKEPSSYIDAIQATNPFADITELGASITFQSDDGNYVEATLNVDDERIIPLESKTLLKSGKLSIKKMPKGQFYELYQDYVCSCALRVARELFALLPIEIVFVSAMSELVNTQTGYKEQATILSVAIPKATLERLNFETIDCSDALRNFVHRMSFNKLKGFNPITPLCPKEFLSTKA